MKQNVSVVMETRTANEILVGEHYDKAPIWGYMRKNIILKLALRLILGVVEILNRNEHAERTSQIQSIVKRFMNFLI